MRSKHVSRAFFPAVFGGLLLTTALPAASHEVPPWCKDPTGQVRITTENFVLCSAFADDTLAVDAVPDLGPDPNLGLGAGPTDNGSGPTDTGSEPEPTDTGSEAPAGNPGNEAEVGGAGEQDKGAPGDDSGTKGASN